MANELQTEHWKCNRYSETTRVLCSYLSGLTLDHTMALSCHLFRPISNQSEVVTTAETFFEEK